MQKIIVYLDDARYAHRQLTQLTGNELPPRGRQAAIHWVLVACAPRMTQRISKWLSHSARENWRTKWADKAFGQIVPHLQGDGDQITTVLATGPLPALTAKLVAQHGASRVLDVRRPRPGQQLPQLTEDPPISDRKWQVPGALTGMGALLVLAAE